MKSFAIIGMGRFGMALAESLYQSGYDVLAVDKNKDNIQMIANKVTQAVAADVNDEDVLKTLGIRNFDAVVVSIASDMQSSILITLMLRELGVNYIISKAQSEIHAKILDKVGADRIVFPERDTAYRVAHSITTKNILNYINLSPKFNIIELEIPKSWDGKSLAQLELRKKYNINVIAIKQPDTNDIDTSPSANTILKNGEILIVSCGEEAVSLIEKIK